LYGITDLVTFVLGTIFIVLLPGPNSVYVLTTSSRQGIRAGYWSAAGVFAGDTVLMVLAATGSASVLYANPTLFAMLKYAGAAYLAYLGLGLLRQAYKGWFATIPANDLVSPDKRPLSSRQPFRTALIVSLLNPKAIFFFISFFIQFVDPSYPHPALTFLLLGLIVQLISLLYLSALILGGNQLAARLGRHRRINAATAASVGILFVAFGVKLADATLG
jgi:leucine efflux protein